jgi:hypothetical protein
MRLGYLSMDELNQSLVARWGAHEGIEVECPDRLDRGLDGLFDALLLDLDHTKSEWMSALARWLARAGRVCCPVAVHGYSATADAFRGALAGRDVTVRAQLQPELIRDLAHAAYGPPQNPVESESEPLTWINLA